MRKRAILAMLLVVALAFTTSCSLIVKDAEVDRQTPIIEVAGKTITKGEVNDAITNTLDYQEYIYSMYGLPFDKTDDTIITEARTTTVDSLIRQAVIDQKKEELGMTTFTDEELAELQTAADDTYTSYANGVKSSEFAETELEGEELDAAVEARMAELGYPTREETLESEKTTKADEKLRDEIVKDVTVSDDEIKQEYDTRVADAKTEYESDLSAYGTAVQNGSTVYYTPAGYRYVKNILRELNAEDSEKISTLESDVSAKQTELTAAQTSLTELGEDATADDENTAATREALTGSIATLETEIADLNKQLDEARETAYAAIQPTVDEIITKLNEGGDFDALMEEYGQDTGMQQSPAKETGYLVCEGSTTWVTEFTQAAMALQKIGDVSPAVRTSYGIHLLQYASDAQEGEVGLDAVKDTIQSDLLSTKQDELYEQTVTQWIADANAKTYLDRLAD